MLEFYWKFYGSFNHQIIILISIIIIIIVIILKFLIKTIWIIHEVLDIFSCFFQLGFSLRSSHPAHHILIRPVCDWRAHRSVLSLAVSGFLGSHSSASRRSGSRVVASLSLLFSSASNGVLERAMASVCIIGSGNWWVSKKKRRANLKERENKLRERECRRAWWMAIDSHVPHAHADIGAHLFTMRVLRFIVSKLM